VLLLHNKVQEYNIPLATFATLPAGKGPHTSELRSCAKRFRGLAVTTLPWWVPRSFNRPCLHAYSCMRPEVRLPLDQHILCSDCCKKIYYV